MTDIYHFDWEPQEQYRARTTSIYWHYILEHLLQDRTNEHVVLWQKTLAYNLKITVKLTSITRRNNIVQSYCMLMIYKFLIYLVCYVWTTQGDVSLEFLR